MPVTITFYEQFLALLGDGTMDMNSDTFKVMLLDNTHVFAATDTLLSDVSTEEIAAGNGYIAGGAVMTTLAYTQTGGVSKWDADDVSWTASGGAIATARFAVLYDDTVTSPLNALVAFIDLGADKTPGDGDTLTIKWDATNGIFTIT